MMQRTPRPPVVVVVALLVLAALAAPVVANASTSERNRRDDRDSRRARAASQLDALKASDVQLERAVADLDRQLRLVAADAASAKQAAAAADAKVKAVERRRLETEKQIGHLRKLAIDRAMAVYMDPQGDPLADFVSAENLDEATRRRALLELVTSGDGDALDQLRAAEEDLLVVHREALAARDEAARRRERAEARLRDVVRARNDKARMDGALKSRIRSFQAEVDALSREEAAVTSLLQGVSGDGGAASGAGLVWPVRGRVTSEYGRRWGRMHAGIDISAPTGTPIRAAKDGVVVFSGRQGGYGNAIIINHGGGFSTLYAHQSRLVAGDGQRVSRGEVIGAVGCSGSCTGPHLHFETRVNGASQNPRRYLP